MSLGKQKQIIDFALKQHLRPYRAVLTAKSHIQIYCDFFSKNLS